MHDKPSPSGRYQDRHWPGNSIPACTPDAGPIRHTVGRLGRLFVELSLVVRKGCAEGCDELSAPLVFLRFELFGDTSRKPTSTGDTVGDELLLAEDKVEILRTNFIHRLAVYESLHVPDGYIDQTSAGFFCGPCNMWRDISILAWQERIIGFWRFLAQNVSTIGPQPMGF